MFKQNDTFVPPLAAKVHGMQRNGPPPFVPPLAAKLAPPVRPAVLATAVMPARLNLKQAAEYLGVSPPTMRKLARDIPHLRVGRILRFDREVLDECLRGRFQHRNAA